MTQQRRPVTPAHAPEEVDDFDGVFGDGSGLCDVDEDCKSLLLILWLSRIIADRLPASRRREHSYVDESGRIHPSCQMLTLHSRS